MISGEGLLIVLVATGFTLAVLVGLCLTGCLWREGSWLNRRLGDHPEPDHRETVCVCRRGPG